MKITRENVEVKISALKPYDKNARTHSARQIDQLVASIKEFGFTNPILIDQTNGVIAGYGRALAGAKAGMTTVPAVRLTGLTETQKKALVIADNRLAENAGWNAELLASELQAIGATGFDLSIMGFKPSEIEKYLTPKTGNTDEDAAPATPLNPITARGDVWLLGPHRLSCGDSTAAVDVGVLMAGKKADLVWTDPPYNIAYGDTMKDKQRGNDRTILNDDMGDREFKEFLLAVFKNYFQVMKDGAVIYVAHAETERVNFSQTFKDSGLKLAQVLIWVKQSGTLSRQDYNWRHEPILYGWKEGAKHYFAGDFTKTTVIDDDLDLGKMSKDQLVQLAETLMRSIKTTAIQHDRPTKSDLHPTMKPVALVREMIESSCTEGQTVLDLFGGSGSTLIACETAGRACYTMELDEKYCDVIIRRWQEFTGQHAVHAATGKKFNDKTTSTKKEKRSA